MLIKGLDKIDSLPAVTSGLLPAIHDASPSDALVTDPVAAAGQVYRNATTASLTLPAALGRPATTVDPGGFYGSDGRLFYPVERAAGTNSFYPLELTRDLFSVYVAEEMFPQAATLRLSFDLALRTFSSNTMAQWVVVLQIGQRASDTSPAPIGLNLKGFEWLAPSVQQPITFGSIAQTHSVGVQIQRLSDGDSGPVFRGSSLAFGVMKACQAPTANGFVLRARLAQFDTENNVASPAGFVAYAMSGGKMEISK
jgi:hypothetical protein